MRLDEILNTYVARVPRFDSLGNNFTGKDLLAHFRAQSKVADIEAFTSLKLHSRFAETVQSQEQSEYLNNKARQIGQLAQQMFERRFPKYYTVDPSHKFQQSLEH